MIQPVHYYFDTHVPKAAAEQLRKRGIEVLRCEEVGMANADDTDHLEFAASQRCTLVSHDRDFWTLHAEWLEQGLHHCGVVLFSRQFQGNIGKIVMELSELAHMIALGAGSLEEDVYNQIYEIMD